MVKRYLVVTTVFWLSVHTIFSWSYPGWWIGVVLLSIPTVVNVAFWKESGISQLTYVPLVLIPLYGCVDVTVWEIFFRCISTGEAHSLSSLMICVLSLTYCPSMSMKNVSRLLLHRRANVWFYVGIIFFMGCLVSLFSCEIVVFELMFVVFLLWDYGKAGRTIAGLILLLMFPMGWCVQTASMYLVVKCFAPLSSVGYWSVLGVLCVVFIVDWFHDLMRNSVSG